MENSNKNPIFLGISKNTIKRLFDCRSGEVFKSLENYKTNKIKNSYDFFNKISKGEGSRAFNKFSYDKIQNSLEYVNYFEYLKMHKTFDLNTEEGKELHIYRNMNQFHKAPKDLKTMLEFVEAGYFLKIGFLPSHNLTVNMNDIEHRKQTILQTIYLIENNLLDKPNNFSNCSNIVFKGTPHSSFEGCEFVYNSETGKLVTDNINRGTWNYGKDSSLTHFTLDIYPWLQCGNGDNTETNDDFVMDENEENLFLNPETIKKLRENPEVLSEIENNNINIKDSFDSILKYFKEYQDVVAIKGKDFVEENNKKISQAREDFVDDMYIKHSQKRGDTNISDIDMAYKDAWYNYISFLTLVESRDIIKDMVNYVEKIFTNPISFKDIISSPEEKENYGELLFKSAFSQINDNNPSNISTKLPISITVYLSNDQKDLINDIKTKLGIDGAIKQYHSEVEEICELLNEKVKRFGISLRTNSDIIDFDTDYDHFVLSVTQERKVSEVEKTILNNKVLLENAKRFIRNNEDITPNTSKEELIRPCVPEYSFESIAKPTIALVAVSIFGLIVGSVKLISNAIDKAKKEPSLKIISNYLVKILSEKYDSLKKEDNTIKSKIHSSNVVKKISELDQYGEYNVYENNDLISKEDFIHKKSMEILAIISKSSSYDEFIRNCSEIDINVNIIDGYISKDVFEDLSLLDELTKFEYGENNEDFESRSSYLRTLVSNNLFKIGETVRAFVKENDKIKFYCDSSINEIDWDRVGKEPIKNQMGFKCYYNYTIDLQWDKLQDEILKLIKK